MNSADQPAQLFAPVPSKPAIRREPSKIRLRCPIHPRRGATLIESGEHSTLGKAVIPRNGDDGRSTSSSKTRTRLIAEPSRVCEIALCDELSR
jgi:hypothetical protein